MTHIVRVGGRGADPDISARGSCLTSVCIHSSEAIWFVTSFKHAIGSTITTTTIIIIIISTKTTTTTASVATMSHVINGVKVCELYGWRFGGRGGAG